MPVPPLTDDRLTEVLAGLPGWTATAAGLTAAYRAPRASLPGFYAAVAAAEDEADHHALITILYRTITFAVNTHDADGAITERDAALAARIAVLAWAHQATISG
jgi:4a-hydroxytetrahydrobiopterin dehydratase